MTCIRNNKPVRILCHFLFALHVTFAVCAGDATSTRDTAGRLAPIIDFALRTGTNRPISRATAKALGLGDETLPATQVAFLPAETTEVHFFGVSTRNTNDLFIALIDKGTRSGKVWLSSPAGEIRTTLLTSSNGPPQVVPNERLRDEFDEEIAFWLLVAIPEPVNPHPLSGDGESLGADRPDASGTVREISKNFGHDELQKLYQLLNSAEFQLSLTNYNCGELVPKLAFRVSLRPAAFATTRAVEIYHSPDLSPSGHTRCLLFGVGYLLDKAVAKLDPDPKQEETREPHCDCSKRDGKEEWVTFPGPDEVLASAKVAAKVAASKADEAEQEREENLATAHLDPSGVQVEPGNASEHLVTRERSLGKLPADANRQLLAIDPSLGHWACVVKRAGKQLVILDGVDGKEYDEIPDHQHLTFSLDGKHLAYIAKRGGKMMVVMDGMEGKAYDSIEEMFHPIFSPDAKRLAYIASKPVSGFPPEKMFAVVDGQEQKEYDLVEGILFSPDSKHLAYNADKKWNRGSAVVLDEKEGETHDQIAGAVFSPDGNRIAYVAYNRTKPGSESPAINFVVLDGKQGKAYKSVSSPLFSPDSKHLAYVAGEGSSGARVLVRDEMEKKYAGLELGPFSPDSQRLACVARFGTNWLVLIDGKKLDPQVRSASGEIYSSLVGNLAFSPNSRHLVYISRVAETNWSVVLDGKVVKSYGRISVPPVFSQDSQRLAYVFERGGKSVPVFGSHEGQEYDKILSNLENRTGTVGLIVDETGVLHALAIRGGEVLRLELELLAK